jgi:AsmA protein
MRKIALVIGIVLLLIIVAAVVFAATFDVNRYRGTIQSQLEKQLERKVTLGDMHLGIFPPRFRVQNLAIDEDPNFRSSRPFVQAQELAVAVKLMPLLRKEVEIDSLNLKRPSVELIKNKQGAWNFASLAQHRTPSDSQQKPFSLGELAIEDGQVAITDLQKGSARSVYDHIDLTLKDYAPNHPFSVDVAAHLPGAGTQEMRLQGKGGPIVQDQPAMTPFQGTLNLKQVGLSGLQKFLDSPALANTDGVLSGDTRINSQGGKLSAVGQMKVENPRLRGLDLGYPITTDFNVTDDLNADLLTLQNTSIKLGSTPLLLDGTVNSKTTPAQLNMRMKASNVSIAEAARLASAAGVAFAPGTTVTGNVNADIQARGSADKPALNGTLAGRNVQVTGKDVAQPVQIPSINLALSPAEIKSNNFNIVSGGTNVAAQFALRQYQSKVPTIDATLRAPNAQLPAVLAIAKAWGATSLDKVTGSGTLNLDAHATGPVKSITADSIVQAVNGNLNLNFNNMRYSGTDISHQLAAIAGFAGSAAKDQGFTNISRMTGDILVRDGVAQTNNLQAALDIGNIGMSGTANLVSQALNLKVMAVLSKDFSQKVGGTGIGGYMQTALANNQGELVIPAIVTGTLENPRFAPDLQAVAQMRLKGLLPNAANPAAGVSGILGGLLGKKNTQDQQAQPQQDQQQQQNPLQDVLGGLFGKKKQQQQQQKQPPQ